MAVPALSIGELARRTGVREETLRVWERRYGLPRPARTSGGHRRYPESDVALVREMRRLIDAGWATGAAAQRVLQVRETSASGSSSAFSPPGASSAPGGPRRPVSGEPISSDEPAAVPDAHADPVATRVSADRPQDRPRNQEVDIQALEATYRATRRLLRMRSPQEAGFIFVDLVRELGGATVPARLADRDALPIDLSFGEGEPILPVAEPFSLARMRLEAILPALVEDARAVVDLLRAGTPPPQEGD